MRLAIPAARAKDLLVDRVPIHTEDFALMRGDVLHGETAGVAVEQFDAAVARCNQQLILMDL